MVRLNETHIISKLKKKQKLSEITSVNVWGHNLTDVQILTNYPQLQVISLAINHLTSLEVFASLPALKELYLRCNLVRDPKELLHLTKLKLSILWLMDNPIGGLREYRKIVLRCLPTLVQLDDVDVTDHEREEAIKLGIPTVKYLNDAEWDVESPTQPTITKFDDLYQKNQSAKFPLVELNPNVLQGREESKDDQDQSINHNEKIINTFQRLKSSKSVSELHVFSYNNNRYGLSPSNSEDSLNSSRRTSSHTTPFSIRTSHSTPLKHQTVNESVSDYDMAFDVRSLTYSTSSGMASPKSDHPEPMNKQKSPLHKISEWKPDKFYSYSKSSNDSSMLSANYKSQSDSSIRETSSPYTASPSQSQTELSKVAEISNYEMLLRKKHKRSQEESKRNSSPMRTISMDSEKIFSSPLNPNRTSEGKQPKILNPYSNHFAPIPEFTMEQKIQFLANKNKLKSNVHPTNIAKSPTETEMSNYEVLMTKTTNELQTSHENPSDQFGKSTSNYTKKDNTSLTDANLESKAPSTPIRNWWLVNDKQSPKSVKDSIRSVANESDMNSDLGDKSNHNILYAVIALVQELDELSLKMVQKEINHLLNSKFTKDKNK
ncbi:hypothetical protein HDV02_002393 [Globomyces sp. JEL0801]|nr:hypothetical protein HDV02_002393 [Globomyces sp. JEL0801]